MWVKSVSLFLIFSSLVWAEGQRTWHTITGSHFDAQLVDVTSTSVTLANGAGKTIDFPIADLMPSDRKFVRSWQQAQAQSSAGERQAGDVTAERTAFAQNVFRDLVALKGSRVSRFTPEPAASPKYFAFYRSAHWCPPCRSFTPKLVKFYKQQKRRDAPFELVFISSDKNEEAMETYMDEYDMPWPAFEFGENKNIVSSNGGGIPNLIVTDAAGKKVLDSYDDSGKYTGPTRVMQELEKLLK